jgi:hypothetical protein
VATERRWRDKDSIDPETNVWPHKSERAARIGDLIAALEKIQEAAGDIELAVNKCDYSGENYTEVLWLSDLSDTFDITDRVGSSSADQVFVDGVPVKIYQSVSGKFFLMGVSF